MKHKSKKTLKGEMYIDTLINIVVVCVLIVFGLAILPILIGQYMLSVEVHTVARDISITGEYINPNDIVMVNGENIPITITGENATYYSGRYLVQLGNEVTVDASMTVHLTIGGIANVPINLNSHATGRSEKYWKELDLMP